VDGSGKRESERIALPSFSGEKSGRGTWQHPTPKRECHDVLSRKEVIQPQVLLRLPCYDFTPIMSCTLGGCSLAVSVPTSSTAHFRDVTGGVYKARERIHRGVLIRDY
jgi:hypothetical protein